MKAVVLTAYGEVDKLELREMPDPHAGPNAIVVRMKLKPGGTIGSILGDPPNAHARGFVVRAFMAHPDSVTLARYAAAVADGKLVIPIARKMPLAEAREAQTLAEKKHPRGKVVLVG